LEEKFMHTETDHWRQPAQGVLWLTLLFVLTAPLAASGGPPEPGGPPPMVAVTPVVEEDISPVTEYVGHVEAIQAVELRARVEGFLEKVNFQEGDFVQAGDLLYVIEQAPYQAKVDGDRARLAAARAELTRAGQRLQRLREARPESIPATDLDIAVAAELTAKAQVAEAEATLANSELELGYTAIKAPINGRIGSTAYTRGNLIGPGSGPLARIIQTDPIRVVYSISENDLPAIVTALHDAEAGARSHLLTPRLRLAGGELHDRAGKVSFVDNRIDSATGTIAVRAEFANPDGLLIPGQYVTVLAMASSTKIMPVVAQAAVLVNRDGRFVVVVDDEGRVATRSITIGPAVSTMWAVESGLSVGDRVIVQGIQKVQPGQIVQIKTTQPEEGGRP
jgi:RND family efflux transporter MFP subunit